MSVGTVDCDECSGGGEKVVLENEDGTTKVVRGVKAVDLIDTGEWTMTGTRECPRCNGFGRLNRAKIRDE